MFDSSKIPWRGPWCSVSPEAAAGFENELRAEMCPAHVLCGQEFKAVARRTDCDDVLFYLGEIGPPLAVVHLTWKYEVNPDWPDTEFFASTEEWIAERLMKDSENDT